MKNTKKAFTLVELIVVITILAILGTIAFISLQGYSSDARNSKRSTDLGSIISKMTIEITKGMSLLSFVKNSDNSLTSASIAGTGTTDQDYNAGAVNYLTLDMKESEFQDPAGKPYVIGVTTRAGAKYQLAATKETGGGAPVAVIKGNFIKRDTTQYTIDAVATNDTTVTLSDSSNSNKIKVGDYVKVGGTSVYNVTKVSDTGMIITLNPAIAGADNGNTSIELNAPDSDSLIGTQGSLGTAVNDGGTNLPYTIN
ncbi:hypothetical protein CSB08_00210 [Candidatus Gracilibacteria bacterium]|nr:MAG: hypothetical protein CSB08_00210 [Candidatus Gracilibacteria bacterium]PIE85267.1 MAG: hypothetical protein CSA08_02560 [Candidatus Gracilibacteria bacterium]